MAKRRRFGSIRGASSRGFGNYWLLCELRKQSVKLPSTVVLGIQELLETFGDIFGLYLEARRWVGRF